MIRVSLNLPVAASITTREITGSGKAVTGVAGAEYPTPLRSGPLIVTVFPVDAVTGPRACSIQLSGSLAASAAGPGVDNSPLKRGIALGSTAPAPLFPKRICRGAPSVFHPIGSITNALGGFAIVVQVTVPSVVGPPPVWFPSKPVPVTCGPTAPDVPGAVH